MVLEKIAKNYAANKPDMIEIIEAITLNNLCSIYINESKYEKVYQHSENALILIENKLFKRIKEEGEATLKKDTQFINDLQVLLQGYIYRGWSQDEIKNQTYQEYIQRMDQGEEPFSDKQKIYNNGYRLSSIILGKESKMAKIFQSLLKSAKQEQQEFIRKMQKTKGTESGEEPAGGIKYYQNRIEEVIDMYGQEYLQSSIEDKLYVLKQTYKKADVQQSFSEQNNITIIDSQEDQAEDQDYNGLSLKTEYIKASQAVSQPSSPLQSRVYKKDSQSNINKKIVFRNQSPNIRVSPNVVKGRRTNNVNSNMYGNPSLQSGLKERAMSHHSGVSSYLHNQNSNQYGANESNQNSQLQNNTNLYQQQQLLQQQSQQSQQPFQYPNNTYYQNEGNNDINFPQTDFQPTSGLNRHQQLQQQLLLQGNLQGNLQGANGNGILYMNKNRFNNSMNNFQNPNFFNNTVDFSNNYNQQQNDFMQPQMNGLNLLPQVSLNSNMSNMNSIGSRFNSIINGLHVQSSNQSTLPSIQSNGMTPNQVLQAQLQNLAGFKQQPFVPQNSGMVNNTNQGFIQQQQYSQLNQKQLLQNQQGGIKNFGGNEVVGSSNNNDNSQYSQYVQDENNKMTNNLENGQNLDLNQNSKLKSDIISKNSLSSKNGNGADQQNRYKPNPANTQENNRELQHKQRAASSNQQGTLSKQQIQQVNQDGVEQNQYNPYFVLNKDYNFPESAAFPSVHVTDNKQVESNVFSSKQISSRQQAYISKTTGTFQDKQFSLANNPINDSQVQQNKIENANQVEQFTIPLHLIDTKGVQSQNGEATKNTKTTTNPSSSLQTPQTNNSNKDKQLLTITQEQDNTLTLQQPKVSNEQKRQKYQEQQRTKEIVSLKNIPNYIGSSNVESQITEKHNGNAPSQQYSTNQTNNIKEEEHQKEKDEILQKQAILPNVTNVKLSESTAYNPSSPKNSIINGFMNNNNLNSPQVTPTNNHSASKGINPAILQSPTNYINNVIMLQNQQFQSAQTVKLPGNLKKIKDEEILANRVSQSPQSQPSSNYSHLSKNLNGNNGGVMNLSQTGNSIILNGQPYFIYPQNNQPNQGNMKMNNTSYPNLGSQSRTQSKQRLPSINAMIQNSNNSQNAINQNIMQLSDISLNKNVNKFSEFDIFTPIGSQRQQQWPLFNETETDYLRHITPEYLMGVNQSVSKVLQFNSLQYLIEVGINKHTTELTFEISGYQLPNKIPLHTENLTLALIKAILNILDLTEGTPFNKPFKTIQGFKDLCQFLIFPFIRINQQERKIEINYTLQSILQYQQWNIEFLQSTCLVTLNHLNNNEFKLTLRQTNSQSSSTDKEQIRIDICFDEPTMNSQFLKLEFPDEKSEDLIDNYERDDIKNIVDLVDWFDEDEVAINKKEKAQEIVQRMQKLKKPQKIHLVNYQIPNTLIFCQRLQDLMNLVQSYLIKTHNYTSFSQYIEDQSLRVLRISIKEDFKKGQIFFIKEILPSQKTICISIQNIHETHAPHGKMVQCVGKKEVEISEFWKTFGVQYETLDREEKYYFLTLMGLKYNLYTHTKPLEQDDYDRYQENPIIQNTISIGGFSRTLKGTSQYKYPLTCQLMGFDDIPYGVKIVLHDQEQNSEWGVFYIIDCTNWNKFKRPEDPNVKKKRTKKYKDEYDIVKNFEIANVLYTVGYKLLENSIGISKSSSNQPHIAGRYLYSGFISNVDRLENIVNFDDISNYLYSLFTTN